MAVAIGMIVLWGWQADLAVLRQGLADWAPVRPWTAVQIILTGIGLILMTNEKGALARAIRMVIAGVVATIAMHMLASDLVGLPNTFENLLFGGRLALEPIDHPGRIAPIIALEFCIAAILLALPSWRFIYVEPAYAVVASIGTGLALTVVIGQLYSAPIIYTEGFISSSAMLASTTNLILFGGFLAARPTVGALRILRSTSLGGIAARRLFPLVVLIPLGIGWVLVEMSRRFTPELSLALFSVLTIAMLLTIVFFVARQLELIDAGRRSAEESAHQHQERLALAQEVAGAGAWDWDVRSDICTWSHSYYRLMGFEPGTVPASHVAFLERVHPGDRSAIIALMEKVVPEGGPFRCEYRIIRPDGRLRHMATLATVHHDDEGKPLRVSGLNFDVTDRVMLADALDRAKRDAENANISKSKFLAAASHDLRQPVQSLTLFVGVLKSSLWDSKLHSALDGIERSAEALRQMLDALLDVSRLDAGIIDPKLRTIALGSLFTALEREYTPRAKATGLRLRFVATRANVRTDPILLERMLRNLIENALRYTKKGGIVVGCRRRGDQVMVMVCDSGIGIAPEDQAAIFEEFHQIDNPERDRAKGLGLGLAIVERMGRLLGHPVSLTSCPGQGSCFTIALPKDIAPPAADNARLGDESLSPPHADDLVIIVEDDQLVRESLGAAFSAWGFKVAMSSSVAEAIRIVDDRGRPPSLVIADHRLRDGETGTAAINALERRCGTTIPALIITGDTAPERLKEATEAGVPLVHKPVSMESLRDAVISLTRS